MPKRPDGEGMVRKRKDGRWEGRIIVGHKDNGKPIYKSVLANNQRELIPKFHRIIEIYRDVELNESYSLTLGEWLDKWLNEYMSLIARQNTLSGYKSIINIQTHNSKHWQCQNAVDNNRSRIISYNT